MVYDLLLMNDFMFSACKDTTKFGIVAGAATFFA
jgi:hypothetical protein